MNFVCVCGSNDFHTFMKYKALDKERLRCKDCSKTYQRDGATFKEIDLKAMWNEAAEQFLEQDEHLHLLKHNG